MKDEKEGRWGCKEQESAETEKVGTALTLFYI